VTLSAMADCCDLIVVELRYWSDQHSWQEGVNSPFGRERDGFRRRFGPGGAWDDADLRRGLVMAFAHLLAATRYLTAISKLLRASEIFALAPLIRSVYELSSRVTWLLDPRLSVRERAARIYLTRLEDATRAKSTGKSLNHPDLVKLGHQVRSMRRSFLTSRFYPSEIADENGILTVCGQKLPGIRAGLVLMDDVYRNGWNSPGIYDYLSDATHPTFYAAFESFDFIRSDEDGRLRWNVNLRDVTFPYRMTRASLLVFLSLWSLLAKYHDIDFPILGDLVDLIDRVPEPEPIGGL
jgi:hypothetical protein